MDKYHYDRIRCDKRFSELVVKRNRFTAVLTTLILLPFFCFIGLVSFYPSVFAQRISGTSQLTIGVIAELFLFVFFILISLLYVKRANGEFDGITRELVAQVGKEYKK